MGFFSRLLMAVSTGGSNFAEHLGEHFGWCSVT